MDDLHKKFLEALNLAAAQKRPKPKKLLPRSLTAIAGDLADDALCNIGILALAQTAIAQAESIFDRLIRDYPQATIAEYPGCSEHGRTAAKALLGLVNCALARGNAAQAKEHAARLWEYEDSWVGVGSEKKTYGQLASELLAAWETANKEYQEQMK